MFGAVPYIYVNNCFTYGTKAELRNITTHGLRIHVSPIMEVASTQVKFEINKPRTDRRHQTISVNNGTVPLLCTSLLISCYMFRFNCHHEGADTHITKTYSNTIITVLTFVKYTDSS